MLTGCTTHQIAEIIMQCRPLRNAVKCLFLNDVNEQCQKLCNRSAENSSVLRTPPSKHKVITGVITITTLWLRASVESKMHSGIEIFL